LSVRGHGNPAAAEIWGEQVAGVFIINPFSIDRQA